MSHSANYKDTGPTTAYYQGVEAERQRSLEIAERFAASLCKCDSCDTARAIAAAIKGEKK